MSQVNYVMILLEGYCNDRTGHLAEHYYREIKKLQNDGYSIDEINGNFQLILTEFQNEIDRPFHNQLNLWYQYEAQQKREKKPLAMEKPTKETFSGTINLFHQSGGRFRGFIYDSDLQKINQTLQFVYQKIQYEKLKGTISDFQKMLEKKAITEQQAKGATKQYYHLDYIKRAINILFTEQIKRDRETESDYFSPTEEGINIKYTDTPIETRNPEKLKEIASKRLKEFLNEHPDNTKEIFIENELEKAKEYQTYFPKYKINREEKEYYFKLQRWIDCLKGLSESKEISEVGQIKNRKKDVPEYNTMKEMFISSEAFSIVMDKLIQEELIDKTSFEWIDKTTGYKSKVAALFYHLYHNKYFRCNELPKPEQIMILVKNGFNVDITVRTIQDKRVNDLRKDFSFIKHFTRQS